MMAVFLSVSQWMFPSVLGFNSIARAKAMVIFQSCRFRRFCHAQSFSAVKLSANKVRWRAVANGVETSCAEEAIVKERRNPKRERSRWTEEQLPNMCSMIPDFIDDRASFHSRVLKGEVEAVRWLAACTRKCKAWRANSGMPGLGWRSSETI